MILRTRCSALPCSLLLVLALALLAALAACKSGDEAAKETSRANPCLPGDDTCTDPTKRREACQAILGARWDAAEKRCIPPTSDRDCQLVRPGLVFDGAGCVAQATPPNFYRLCRIASELAPAVQHTIAVLRRPYGESSCLVAFQELAKLEAMAFVNEGIADVSPLQGFGGHGSPLRELNLDINQIVDVRPLATLSSLVSLRLGHNRIVDVTPLVGLAALQFLYLFENQIVDATALTRMVSLKFLDLERNRITNLAPLTAWGSSPGNQVFTDRQLR